MRRREFVKYAGVSAVLLGLRSSVFGGRNKKPNIIFIMVDDMGSQWTSCYGGEAIRTPNIDALAAGGMMFENAYSMPQCTPTRVALLSGQYPWRTGWINHWDVPRWGVGYFDWREYATFGNIMKSAGYATCAAGKWQINDFRLRPDAMEKCGFDEYCMWTGFETGVAASRERYWDPYLHTKDGSKTYKGKFGPEVVCDFVVDFMRSNKDKPMMIYYPMILSHAPYTDTPHERGVTDNVEKYKAMTRYVDHIVGRVVKSCEELGIAENTIIIWTTDNGGGPATKRNGRVVKGGKGKTSENGVCAPFIVNCPGLVPRGVKTDALTDFTDMLPTFAELGGGKLPDVAIDGKSIAPLLLGKAKDSPRKWIMAMGGGAGRLGENGQVANVYEYRDRVIRDKRYKVWIDTDRKTVRLHDLKKDPYEENNLIGSGDVNHIAARKKLEAVAKTFPDKDPSPRYKAQPPNPWDKVAGKKKRKKK